MLRTVAPRRILLTGADGFAGAWALRQLESRRLPDLEIFAGVHKNEFSYRGARAIGLDVADRARVAEVVQAVKPSVVIHLAAVSTVHEARKDPRRAWEVNLGGTMNLAEALLRHSPQARLIAVSTSEVYGGAASTRTGALDETTALDPLNAYAASKAAADLLIGQMAREGLSAVRIRPFNHTGPGQTENFVIPAFATQIARIEAGLQEPVMRVGNLEARRDFLDVRDVTDAYIDLAFSASPFEPGLVLNLASGTSRRIGEILNELLFLASVDVHVEIDPSRMRASETPFTNADATRIRNLLGWRSRIPWSRTLADVLEFCRNKVARK